MSYLEHALAPAGAAFRVVLFAAPIPTQQKLSTVCMKEGEILPVLISKKEARIACR